MISKLLNYQETDLKLKELESELGGSEERKRAVSAKKVIEGAGDTLAKIEARAEELTVLYENLVNLNKEIQEKIKDFEPAINGATDEGEIAYLIKKADELSSKIAKLEKEINALSDDMKGVIQNYLTLKKNNEKARAEYEEYGAKYKELKAKKEPEIKKIKEELALLEKEIDADLIAKYKAKREEKIFPVLVKLEGDNRCSKCKMELSLASVSKLNTQTFIECEYCRRLIYKGN
jgi:predicted  nucleic acid-binding Zn-ribbon protein